jgi:GT2 family glycosyltransferase
MKTRQRIRHGQYVVDCYEPAFSNQDARLAAVVLNRNLPNETDALCRKIIERSGPCLDLYVVESGSESSRLSQYTTFHFVDTYARTTGLRIARGLNNGCRLAEQAKGANYDVFWFSTNDVVLMDDVNYAQTLLGIFDRNPEVGIIELCHEPNRYYELCYDSASNAATQRQLRGHDDYTASIRKNGFSIVPFPIVRSIAFRSTLFRELAPFLDESNWRNWGNDEDLGYRAWEAGWWVVTCPYCSISEEIFLSVKKCDTTASESLNSFKANAEREMHDFVARKYGLTISHLRKRICAMMLEHLDAFRSREADIAHTVPACSAFLVKQVRQIKHARNG